MKAFFPKLVILCLVVALVSVGCRLLQGIGTSRQMVDFEDMEYVRPDVGAIDEKVADCLELANEGRSVSRVIDAFNGFYSLYADYVTNYYLAYIHYSIDMTDGYWEDEYHYCAERSAQVDAAREELLYGLADSPMCEKLESDRYFGEGYFDDFHGESLWTDAFTDLMEQESRLQSEYYELSSGDIGDGTELAELFVEMVALRQQIAQEAGYDSYPEFAYEFYFQRSYDPDQVADYLDSIRRELVPLYIDPLYTDPCLDVREVDTDQTFGYVESMAKEMGGSVWEAFQTMDELDLYHIRYGENKLASSFEIYLLDYALPFVFVDPSGWELDQLTFAHEFGHYCNDYVSYGTSASMDLAEFFSQGMEYLSLCYADGGEDLEAIKMSDSLCVFVEQAAYAQFELAVYDLEGDALTVENVDALFQKVGEDFGFGIWQFDCRMYVEVIHFFTSPHYVISYVVSNDAAMQLYQMEQEKEGSGLEKYMQELDTTHSDLIEFLEETGLESPFAEGRIEKVGQTIRQTIG